MWTQHDQLQAGQFLRRRIVSALQFGDANHPTAPGRRVSLATVSGLGAALLVMAGFLVYGVLRPGSAADWRQPGQILIEKDSGALHVLGSDGLMHPVLNYASARLLIGGGRTTSISAAKLADAPRGRPLGIPDAPATLPAASALVPGPWTVCAGPDRTVTLLIGTSVPTGPEQAFVVATADDTRYLLTDGRRFRMRDAAAVALGYDGVRPMPVTDAWLGALPAGPDLAPMAVRGAGTDGPDLLGQATRLGQVLRTEDVNGQRRYYVVTSRGLTPVTEIEAALILADPANRPAYPDGAPQPLEVAASDIAASGVTTETAPASRYPGSVPAVKSPDASRPVLCTSSAHLWAAAAPPLPAGARAMPVGDRKTGNADQVYVTAGHGLLAGDGKDPAATLITDQGIRYPVGAEDLGALGYDGAQATPVADGLLTLLPAGPRLSAEAARQEYEQ